ncbi:uncharacterized protein LOC123011750 [Tribolium madens]|uniref:uncharacterized protein LOC123011750 n=1 Tax=Tribolium madens TaxID=41895 RepID=UPI001CF7560D|nr:uncharacterized protein LOC123011750 [Tribolium madens]
MNSPLPQSPRTRRPSGGRRPPTHLHSDCPPEPEDCDSPGLGQRSVSLTTLQPAIIQPRMAQLETLEAKMASIEVSLSSTPRRKKNITGINASIRSIPKEIAAKELETLRNALRDKENIIQSLKGQLTIPGLRLSQMRNPANSNRDLTEIEKKQAEERLNRLKTDVDNKRLAIKNLKMALERLDITDNIDVRIQQAELEYQLGREELNLLTLLEETRALQLCLDESNKNSSESHTLYSCVNGSVHVILLGVEVEYDPKSPKFGASQKEAVPGLWIDWALEETGLCKGDRLVEVNGKIVLTKNRDDLSRLLAAAPDPAQIVILRKLAQNGTTPSVGTTSKEVASLRCELEAVRERADEAQKTKENLISDNIRLTHRISYLEEQVSELLCRKKSDSDVRILAKTPVISTVKTNQNVTNINITTQPTSKELQVFQKGQVTALVANIPGLETSKDTHSALPVRSKSSLSNVSNTHIPAPESDHHCHKTHRHKHRSRHGLQTSASTQNLDQNDKITYRKHNHHHHHREKDYSSETNSAIEHVTRYNKRNSENGYKYSNSNSEKDFGSDIMDQSYKKATKIVHELTRDSLYEKHRQKCLTASEKYNSDILKHYNARKSTSVLDFRSEIHIGPKYPDSKSVEDLDEKKVHKKIQDARSVKSLDFDSDCTSHKSKSIDYTSEPIENRKLSGYSGYYEVKPRPTPPKKPLRLSLHKTQSLQSVETPTPGSSPGKGESRKRNYKGEIGMQNGCQEVKWASFGHKLENGVESGSWC